MTVLTTLSIAATLVAVMLISVSFGEIRFLILPLALRGTVISSWVSALMVIGASWGAIAVRNRQTLELIVTVVLVLSILSATIVLAAGIDVTRVFTSPVTLTEHLGEGFSKFITKGRYTPSGLKGNNGAPVVRAAVDVTTAIVTSTLISYLPYPYNVILFFMYYKFLTAIIFCIFTFGFAAWAVLYVYDYRKTLKAEHEPIDGGREFSEDSHDSDEEPLVRHHRHAGFIGRYPKLDSEKSFTLRQNSKLTVVQGI
jgi:hypothetical protein